MLPDTVLEPLVTTEMPESDVNSMRLLVTVLAVAVTSTPSTQFSTVLPLMVLFAVKARTQKPIPSNTLFSIESPVPAVIRTPAADSSPAAVAGLTVNPLIVVPLAWR